MTPVQNDIERLSIPTYEKTNGRRRRIRCCRDVLGNSEESGEGWDRSYDEVD